MKKLTLMLVLAGCTSLVIAEEYPHEQFAYQAPVAVPFDSTPYLPQDTMPLACKNDKVAQYIKDWEAGKIDFNTIKADSSIPEDQQYCKGLDDQGNIHKVVNCDVKNAPVGYFWKELSDYPEVIGITDGAKTDHEPHYHAQPECYYIVKGKTKFLADNRFVDIKKGQYVYIPGNTIHNIPFYEGTGVLYWYPKNAHFNGFKYYWRKDVKNLRVAEEAFDRVDAIRKRDLGLGPYGTNADKFK